MADNKVKFLRGTSAEYKASPKDKNTFYYTTDTKKLYLGETEITGIEIDDTSTAAIDKTWSAKKISDSIPTTLPANGGNAATVNSHTVESDVPADAVFTDTKVTAVGNHYTPSGGSTTSASGGTLTDITNSGSGVQVLTGVTKDAAGHVTGVTSVALKSVNTTYSAATASAAGIVSTSAQTFAGNKTFNGQVIPAGASDVGTAQARKIYAGTNDMTAGTTSLASGTIYLVYE